MGHFSLLVLLCAIIICVGLSDRFIRLSYKTMTHDPQGVQTFESVLHQCRTPTDYTKHTNEQYCYYSKYYPTKRRIHQQIQTQTPDVHNRPPTQQQSITKQPPREATKCNEATIDFKAATISAASAVTPAISAMF